MGPSILNHPSRFVDTFFHPKEVIREARYWWEWFEENDFEIKGVFDRYRELDFLKNPLWDPPKGKDLDTLSEQGYFYGNLELLVKKKKTKKSDQKYSRKSSYEDYILSLPPKSWFCWEETFQLSFKDRFLLWYYYQKFLFSKDFSFQKYEKLLRNFSSKND